MMSDTFFIPFEYCQRWAIRLDRFDMGSEQLRMPGLGSYLHVQRNGLTLEDKRGQFCSGVFIGGGHIGCHHAKSRMPPSPAARRKSPAEMVTQPFQQHAAHANKSSGI